jgi:hypothetical protein
MIIFSIIIFGLATIRTITPLTKEETYKSWPNFIGQMLVTVLMVWCYIWYLQQIIG